VLDLSITKHTGIPGMFQTIIIIKYFISKYHCFFSLVVYTHLYSPKNGST